MRRIRASTYIANIYMPVAVWRKFSVLPPSLLILTLQTPATLHDSDRRSQIDATFTFVVKLHCIFVGRIVLIFPRVVGVEPALMGQVVTTRCISPPKI